jgi:hypothetical protein
MVGNKEYGENLEIVAISDGIAGRCGSVLCRAHRLWA